MKGRVSLKKTLLRKNHVFLNRALAHNKGSQIYYNTRVFSRPSYSQSENTPDFFLEFSVIFMSPYTLMYVSVSTLLLKVYVNISLVRSLSKKRAIQGTSTYLRGKRQAFIFTTGNTTNSSRNTDDRILAFQ